jgi:hypothetical protein
MFEEENLVQELGIENLTRQQQQNVIDEFKIQVGEALSANLSADKLKEFELIINGDQQVIDSWLSNNVPDYRSQIAYQELQAGYDEDPDKVPGDKAYATLAWVEVNSPDFRSSFAAIKENIKVNIDQYQD